MHVAITGAAGQIGEIAREAFEPAERTLFTHSEHEGLDATVLEVTDREAVGAALADAGADVLLHLAWGPAGRDDWEDGHASNLEGTIDVLEAAVEHDLDRVVLASSIHAVGMYNRERADEMESLVAEPATVIGPDDPPRPDSYYGVAKVACEAMGRYYADRYDLEVVPLRIGWVCDREELRAVATAASSESDRARGRFARATWLSPRDCRAVCEAAVRADLGPAMTPGRPLPAISANADRFQTLAPTMRAIGYRPRDDAAAVLDKAERGGTAEEG
ncbi:NAD dependent epimerase/dehydratase family protein [Salinarchaeum sp. Harcht-Bsk1]|uniref:NAD-dependent epimerase/dehydratase family protein n=1 Tax=Salinarchaeum sp. Harcht-Bsk1 TaxID=1333523 RepID=UPI0003423CAF|nr:NAD(P)-dependent oxidoreductase [Salinarchaeum sp. Harcht-Bsk1]AGN01812.1 NAD dependent epimerase/dehydratase family protein [Salinarchaeum sp. Harcht-Bsk1]